MMKLVILLTMLFQGWCSFANENLDENYYLTQPLGVVNQVAMTPEDLVVLNNAKLRSSCDQSWSSATEVVVVIEKIINLGEKIWQLIERGRPSVSAQGAKATALPQGVECWNEMEGWQEPVAQAYEVSYKNLYGTEVVKFRFLVTQLFGGSYKGAGKYIASAQVLPTKVNVKWGFDFTAEAVVDNILNMGTKQNPHAGIQMKVNWRVKNVFQDLQEAEVFFLNADGAIKKVSSMRENLAIQRLTH
jgi:hypothetical protein